MRIDVITIFPGMLNGFQDESMLKRAADNGYVEFRSVNPRDFTSDVHRTTDDRPYGGGPGMVMKPGPLFDAVESVKEDHSSIILMTPRGKRFSQSMAEKLYKHEHLVFVCGHYEGVDERVHEALVTDEISIGDYVLTNGALAAAVVIDAIVRLLPGVVGGEGATKQDSFSSGMLEYPQYTRPANFRDLKVPDVLLSGDHGAIANWRNEQARSRTMKQRPDLLDG